jgi:hypothetical protein
MDQSSGSLTTRAESSDGKRPSLLTTDTAWSITRVGALGSAALAIPLAPQSRVARTPSSQIRSRRR